MAFPPNLHMKGNAPPTTPHDVVQTSTPGSPVAVPKAHHGMPRDSAPVTGRPSHIPLAKVAGGSSAGRKTVPAC